MTARLQVSTDGTDADLFLINGWLRLSHRKTDPTRRFPWRPWHTHDENLSVVPDTIYLVDIEIWPTQRRISCPMGGEWAIAPTMTRKGNSLDTMFPKVRGELDRWCGEVAGPSWRRGNPCARC